MIVKPFAALRPQKKYVKECAALPYDVMSSDEAREEVKGKPYSFLHIDKAEIDLDPSVDLYDDAVYAKAAEDFAIIKDARSINLDGSLIHLAVVPCYSKNIELAKEFLRYVYTDNGFKTFAKNTRGNVWITDYDYENSGVEFNNFAKSALKVMQTSTNLNFYNR